MKSRKIQAATIFIILLISSCTKPAVQEINLGYIGPLTVRATDLGIGPSHAMTLAVDQYNSTREEWEPKVNIFIEDDQWEKSKAQPAYDKMRLEHKIDVLFISNTGGTVALQGSIMRDKVICINSLNSDELLSSMNENTFTVAKSTEDANGLVGLRIIEKGLKKVVILHYPNDFMSRAAKAVKKILDEREVENIVLPVEIDNIDFTEILQKCKDENYDAYVFFGYKAFGFASKQARELGIDAQLYGSTTLLDPAYYDNSEGAIIGSEFPFFLPQDGNDALATEFLDAFEIKFGEKPTSVWPTLQAYDAMNIVLEQLKDINNEKDPETSVGDWLKEKLPYVTYFQGVCGNLSIDPDRRTRGIYFSLYSYTSKGIPTRIE